MAVMKRAITDEAKQAREASILAVAEALLMDIGFHQMSMDDVAKASGLAKGTLYLYFKTKEELLLRVFERQIAAWFEDVTMAIQANSEDRSLERLGQVLIASFVNQPLLTRLIALLAIMIEYNVAYERVREHKLWLYAQLAQLGTLIETQFGLAPMQGAQFLLRLSVCVSGLEGMAHPSPVANQVYETDLRLWRVDFETELSALVGLLLRDLSR